MYVVDTQATPVGHLVFTAMPTYIRSSKTFYVEDDANGKMSQGITINQAGNNDAIFALKSSLVDHAMTALVENDTWFQMLKYQSTGGANIRGATEGSIGIQLASFATSANTTKTASGTAGIHLGSYITNGSTSVTSMSGNGNLVAIQSGGTTRALVDAEGDLYIDNGGLFSDPYVQVFDEYDDALLIRALDHAKGNFGAKGIVKERWDDFVKYNEEDLIKHSILGDTIENGGFINVTGLQRLHNGAIWQGYTRQMELQERVYELEARLLALEGA